MKFKNLQAYPEVVSRAQWLTARCSRKRSNSRASAMH
jgi:hypothetical protein